MRKWLSLIEMYCADRGPVKHHCGNDGRPASGPSTWRPGCARPRHFKRRDRLPHPRFVLILALAVSSFTAGRASAQCPPLDAASAPSSTAPVALTCRFDGTLTRLFTPPAAPSGVYRVYVASAKIEDVVEAFRSVARSEEVRGAWTVQETDPLSAFGDAGPYNRTKVAQLYVGVPVRVARGPIVRDGRTVASITLVSPYPDPTLMRLERGTLIIQFDTARSVR